MSMIPIGGLAQHWWQHIDLGKWDVSASRNQHSLNNIGKRAETLDKVRRPLQPENCVSSYNGQSILADVTGLILCSMPVAAVLSSPARTGDVAEMEAIDNCTTYICICTWQISAPGLDPGHHLGKRALAEGDQGVAVPVHVACNDVSQCCHDEVIACLFWD
jgi:hypothetical protein